MGNDEKVKTEVLSENFRAGLIIENSLLKKINGVSILENLIKNNEKIPECNFNRRESLILILKYKRYDLLDRVTIKNLIRKRTKEETYLDYILELSKKDNSINISFYDPFVGIYPLKDIATFYITYAKHDLQDYLPRLGDIELQMKERNPILKALTFNKNFLSMLLKDRKYNDLVMSKLISKGNIKDLEVILTLNDSNYKAPLDIQDTYSKKYIEEENNNIDSIINYLRPKDQDYLLELKNIMTPRCDEEAINTAIYSYAEQLYYGNREVTYAEIRRLIDIFKIDKSFSIKMGNESCFLVVDNQIILSNMSTKAFNHELGHMMYHKLTDKRNDSYFMRLVEDVRNNPNVLDKVDSLSKNYQGVKKQIKNIAKLYYEEESSIDFNSKEEDERIEKMLSTEKEELMEVYKRKGYSKDVLNEVLNNTYTLEEYKAQHKSIQLASLYDNIGREKAGPILQISDIMDAIYKGQFLAGKLKNSYGEAIKPITGHGIFYYNNNEETIFDEIFANYCTLRKSLDNNIAYYNDPVKGPLSNPIECLKAIVGDEMVNYLENFYEQEILDSNKYVVSRSR